jgi:predicted PurR-regulated permease PerM
MNSKDKKISPEEIDAGHSPQKFWKIFFIFLISGISILFIFIVRQFIMPVLLAAITVGLFSPLHRRLSEKMDGKRRITAAITTCAVFLIVLLPTAGIAYYVVDDLIRLGKHFTENITSIESQLNSVVFFLEKFPLIRSLNLSKLLGNHALTGYLQDLGKLLVKYGGNALRDILRILLLVFIYLYCLFFFFKDGESILRRIFLLIPMPKKDTQEIFNKFVAVTRAMIKNTLIIGVIQGLIGGFAFLILGLSGPLLWGIVIMLLSSIPNIGAAIVWVPAVLFLFISGKTVKGIILFAVGVGLIGTVDYIIRPHLIGEEINIHKILILFGVLGGIALFGVFGIIIGPIIMSVFVTLWEIYAKVFSKELENIPQ